MAGQGRWRNGGWGVGGLLGSHAGQARHAHAPPPSPHPACGSTAAAPCRGACSGGRPTPRQASSPSPRRAPTRGCRAGSAQRPLTRRGWCGCAVSGGGARTREAGPPPFPRPPARPPHTPSAHRTAQLVHAAQQRRPVRFRAVGQLIRLSGGTHAVQRRPALLHPALCCPALWAGLALALCAGEGGCRGGEGSGRGYAPVGSWVLGFGG